MKSRPVGIKIQKKHIFYNFPDTIELEISIMPFFPNNIEGRSPPTINLISLGYKNTPGIPGGRYMRGFRRSSGGVTWEKQRHSD